MSLGIEFITAIEIAYSNYRKEKKNRWYNMIGFGMSKIPKIDLKSLLK